LLKWVVFGYRWIGEVCTQISCFYLLWFILAIGTQRNSLPIRAKAKNAQRKEGIGRASKERGKLRGRSRGKGKG
jgi:hypothetical protein